MPAHLHRHIEFVTDLRNKVGRFDRHAKLRRYGVSVTELSSFQRGRSAASAVLNKRGNLPRRTVLSRLDPFNPRVERLIAANIDLVANVVSIKSPPLRPRLIDRFLIATQRGGAQAAICVNKIDLVSDRDDALSPLRVYQELQIPVIACSTKTGESGSHRF